MTRQERMFVDENWVKSESGREFPIVNPATEKAIVTAPEGTTEDARAAIGAARRGFAKGIWSSKTPPPTQETSVGKYAKSAALYGEAKKYIPGGASSILRWASYEPHPQEDMQKTIEAFADSLKVLKQRHD